ncbi:Aldehyde/histidinol dehydrogenase [Hypoxylon fragiforme]|uniref:Aldehyde/histidinol dehydrogenase n=1 Tax=Hypoxylon fragiforme TaxID=63214 RepID=UPI0020C6B8EB|nr:Aldehyde/histidinol dehydrogenase [Hypoxylon fragiforme]KAI2605363.1 Aldehyde/histidinol dehydrogenase [Hypoxylon fragiforme]
MSTSTVSRDQANDYAGDDRRRPERTVTTHHTPIGVTVGTVPYNYPIFPAYAKVGPALLTGNVFILRASPSAPYCCLKLAELGSRFFPPGVFQALGGDKDLSLADGTPRPGMSGSRSRLALPLKNTKQSGIGVEWGVEGLKAYCNLQSVCTN